MNNQNKVFNYKIIRFYRTYDGTCNNLENPVVGSVNTPYIRILPPAYQDGFDSPRTLNVAGTPLPNPRSVSLSISQPQVVQRLAAGQNHLFVFFGQFITHDMGATSTTVGNHN